jgi:hypothetical protein
MKGRKKMTKSWVLATIAGILVAFLYMYQNLGVSVVLVTSVFIYSIYVFRKEAGLPTGRRFFILGGYSVILSLNFAVTTISTIRFYSGLIGVCLLLALCLCELEFRWPKWVMNGVLYFGNAIALSISYFNHGSKNLSKSQKTIRQILLGLILSVPMVFVAVVLLSSADVLFSEALGNMIDAIQFGTAMEFGIRVVVLLVVAAVTYGMRQYLLKKGNELKDIEIIESEKTEHFKILPPVVAGTILVSLNTVYLTFAYFQIRFLYFADRTTSLESYNYADYARQGFFELLALSILNTIGILVIHKLVQSNKWVQFGLTVTVLCTYIMMVSSFYKMYLYESTYGYTRSRLYVYLILVFMVVFMTLILIGVWRLKFLSIEYAIIFGLCYYLIISFVNIDAMIVTNNIHHYEVTGELDMFYLTTLSEDGIPELVDFMAQHQEAFSKDEVNYYTKRIEQVKHMNQQQWFFEYNIRKSNAVRSIE